jgi:hypothetical protein
MRSPCVVSRCSFPSCLRNAHRNSGPCARSKTQVARGQISPWSVRIDKSNSLRIALASPAQRPDILQPSGNGGRSWAGQAHLSFSSSDKCRGLPRSLLDPVNLLRVLYLLALSYYSEDEARSLSSSPINATRPAHLSP